MSGPRVSNPRRRQFLAGVGAGLVTYGTGVGAAAADDPERVEVVLDNVGANAWELVSADEDVGEEGVDNPELTLQEGTRYTFVNRGSGPHPLEFRDANGNSLLSQQGTGSYETDADVNYEENDEDMIFTLTEPLAEDLNSYICTAHPSMEGSIQTVDGEEVDATVTFPNQATAASTFTDDEPTDPAVSVSVEADTDSAVIVTYEGDDPVVAGLEMLDSDELEGEEVVIPIEDDGGFPGEHVAHVIPTDDLSGEYEPGDTVSTDTVEAVADDDTATVVQATLSLEDGHGDEPIDAGDVIATADVSADGGGADPPYAVDMHPTDDGELVEDEFIGTTDVLSGTNENVEVVAERVPDDGDFNELPFDGTDQFVAMIHLVDDHSPVGDAASPGSFPVLPNVDAADGPVSGGVTDRAEVTIDPAEDDTDVDDDGDDDDGDDDEPAVTDDADDDVPGFGPAAAAAGLGGLTAYAYRKLRPNGEPSSPDDELDEQDG